jgi:hypothetical protein
MTTEIARAASTIPTHAIAGRPVRAPTPAAARDKAIATKMSLGAGYI